ncbi:MAG TPA: ATP-dependent protease, Lon family [Firmicutes bacterium]|nr:ATP-dependent protease, Lon family [Bacillota bacterium]HHY98931.1 ATP-dependent protease, Lon family [Bacillota bacterium]
MVISAFIRKLAATASPGLVRKLSSDEQVKRQAAALFGLLSSIYGADKLILRASKLDALSLMRSHALEERVLALQRLINEDPTIETVPRPEDIPAVLEELEDQIADLVARKAVEDRIEKQIAEKMQKRHEEYVREIKMQLIKEQTGPDNAQTLKKYAQLEKLEQRRLTRSVLEILRPSSLKEVIGQERAIKALLTKIATPFPQHVILYGPPGVGKTTAARLVLEEAKKSKFTPFDKKAKFVEVDGTTLRWDPREVTNPLLGSVHDPIYQGARKDFAESGVPEPKLGLVTEAHGGVLFIDEIGELEPLLLNKLLKVLEDKRVIFDSSYYDPDDPHVPKYIKKLFEEGAPADFVLIGATTRDPEEISPALRSRAAEVFFEPLTSATIQQIVRNAARKLKVNLEEGLLELISDYATDGRKAVNILADAYGVALHRARKGKGADNSDSPLLITCQDVREVIQTSRLIPSVLTKASDTSEVGRVLGLGVREYLGSIIEIEAIAFDAKDNGKGSIRFNETAGSMARDSVFNAASVFRRLTGQDLSDWDVHVNVVGGGLIDGPSAGAAVLTAIYSAVKRIPVRQNVAITGELSIQGKIKPVGGIFEKIYAARQAGMRTVIIPAENAKDVPPELTGIKVILARDINDILDEMLVPLEVENETIKRLLEGEPRRRLKGEAGIRRAGKEDIIQERNSASGA